MTDKEKEIEHNEALIKELKFDNSGRLRDTYMERKLKEGFYIKF